MSALLIPCSLQRELPGEGREGAWELCRGSLLEVGKALVQGFGDW